MDVFFTLFQISFSFFLDALMKVRLPLPLLAALAAAFPAATAAPAGTELGNVMFVGDSITHGVNSASYRWALHKIFTDNGISYRRKASKPAMIPGELLRALPTGARYSTMNIPLRQAPGHGKYPAGATETGLTAPTLTTGWGFPAPRQTEAPIQARHSPETIRRIPFS